MKNHARIFFALFTASALLLSSAQALSFSGVVSAKDTIEIYAPIGGTVENVYADVGKRVQAGEVIASLNTEKVYAAEDGIVTGIFGEAGDNAETIAERYGAVMYLEGESVYSISASTENAYNTTENKFVHVGETVYLYCYSHGTHTGSGVITSIEGTDFNVDVTSGEFLLGESVSVFRGDSATSANRIGRGDLNRKNPTAISGTGSIVSIAVQDGDSVQKGDLLFETLQGSFDGLMMQGAQISANAAGVIAQMNLSAGGKAEKGAVAAVIYPEGEMRVEAQVSEYDLSEIAVGDRVNVELIWNQDMEVNYEGEIAMISAIASESAGAEEDSGVTYTVYVDFTPDANTRYGMSAVVSTMDEIEGEGIEDAA